MIILHWACSTGNGGNGWCSSLPFSICGRTPSVQKTIQQVEEMRKVKRVFPPPQDVFKAFLATPLEKVRVVIVGQDSWLHEKVRKIWKNLTCDRISTGLRVKLLKCGLTRFLPSLCKSVSSNHHNDVIYNRLHCFIQSSLRSIATLTQQSGEPPTRGNQQPVTNRGRKVFARDLLGFRFQMSLTHLHSTKGAGRGLCLPVLEGFHVQ